MELWELSAREEIRTLVAAYNTNGDAGRLDQMLAVFTDDAVMEIEGDQTVGKEAIRAFMTAAGHDFVAYVKATGAPRAARVVQHFTSAVLIELTSPTEAHGDLYYQAIMQHGLDHWGRYRDDYRLVDGRWRIAHRREWMDGPSPGGMGAWVRDRQASA